MTSSSSSSAKSGRTRDEWKAVGESEPLSMGEASVPFSAIVSSFESPAERAPLSWEAINSPDSDTLLPYGSLAAQSELGEDVLVKLLGKMAVCKMNGGLGTSMGCVGPKSAIPVRDGKTFLDLSVEQIEYLNGKFETKVPLVLMNSFNTDDDTAEIISKYESRPNVEIMTFCQNMFPRLREEDNTPLPLSPPEGITDPKDKRLWYPPGHGDIYASMQASGTLDTLLSRGIEWLFLSNADNLGATVDLAILAEIDAKGFDFVMEVTDKTLADVKGGTIVTGAPSGAKLSLLEVAQVPEEHLAEFKSIDRFSVFNTNNLWVNLKALKALMVESGNALPLEIIRNPKRVEGVNVVQLETAAGAAISLFKNPAAVNVPRRRFLPVKTTNDLFIVKSDLYTLGEEGVLTLRKDREGKPNPSVSLGPALKEVSAFDRAFAKGLPSIIGLDALTVESGSFAPEEGVTLEGKVTVRASSEGDVVVVKAGSVVKDETLS